jgi:hypothetical protein
MDSSTVLFQVSRFEDQQWRLGPESRMVLSLGSGEQFADFIIAEALPKSERTGLGRYGLAAGGFNTSSKPTRKAALMTSLNGL